MPVFLDNVSWIELLLLVCCRHIAFVYKILSLIKVFLNTYCCWVAEIFYVLIRYVFIFNLIKLDDSLKSKWRCRNLYFLLLPTEDREIYNFKIFIFYRAKQCNYSGTIVIKVIIIIQMKIFSIIVCKYFFLLIIKK